MGKAEEPDDSGYLKWRRDEESPRMRRVGRALYVAFWPALSLPRYFGANHAVVVGFEVGGLTLGCVGIGIGLSKIHSY